MAPPSSLGFPGKSKPKRGLLKTKTTTCGLLPPWAKLLRLRAGAFGGARPDPGHRSDLRGVSMETFLRSLYFSSSNTASHTLLPSTCHPAPARFSFFGSYRLLSSKTLLKPPHLHSGSTGTCRTRRTRCLLCQRTSSPSGSVRSARCINLQLCFPANA